MGKLQNPKDLRNLFYFCTVIVTIIYCTILFYINYLEL